MKLEMLVESQFWSQWSFSSEAEVAVWIKFVTIIGSTRTWGLHFFTSWLVLGRRKCQQESKLPLPFFVLMYIIVLYFVWKLVIFLLTPPPSLTVETESQIWHFWSLRPGEMRKEPLLLSFVLTLLGWRGHKGQGATHGTCFITIVRNMRCAKNMNRISVLM